LHIKENYRCENVLRWRGAALSSVFDTITLLSLSPCVCVTDLMCRKKRGSCDLRCRLNCAILRNTFPQCGKKLVKTQIFWQRWVWLWPPSLPFLQATFFLWLKLWHVKGWKAQAGIVRLHHLICGVICFSANLIYDPDRVNMISKDYSVHD